MTKRSLDIPNIANVVDAYVSSTWPELTAVGGVWFTGSRIWLSLYPDLPRREPPPESAWDIFVTREDVAAAVVDRLGLRGLPACRTQDKRSGAERTISADHVPLLTPPSLDDEPTDLASYDDGWSYATSRGVLDLWITRCGDVVAELRTFPPESHAHCRAAFSFMDGLVILPNERAR